MGELRIAFLGQCLVHGYEGVDGKETFPNVLRARILAEKPGVAPRVSVDSFYHPAELPRKIARASTPRPPDVLVIDVAGYFAARDVGAVDLSQLPHGINTGYERARHFRAVAKGLLRAYPAAGGLLRRLETTGVAVANGILRPLLRRYPTPTLPDYEQFLEDAVHVARRTEGMTVVLQGPGMFNDGETDRRYAPNTQEIYRQVNGMVRRVAETNGLLFVDRMAVTDSLSVCLPGSIRLSAHGHRVMADVLLEALVGASVV